MQYSRIALYLLILTIALPIGQTVFGQSTQSSTSVSLNHFNVQITYPSEVMPGDSIAISIQATAKNGFYLTSLIAQVYYSTGNNLQQLTSATITSNQYVYTGNTASKSIQVTVPADAPRTSLFTVVTENINVQYYDYSYNYYPYPYYSSYMNYSYYYPYYASYPSYYNYAVSDNGLASLSYIKAQTPEYVALQSQYQNAQQQLTQIQSQNQQLQQQLQDQQSQLTQKNSQINDLNNQLNSVQTTMRELEIGIVVLILLAVVFGAMMLRGISSRKPKEQNPSQPATAQEHPEPAEK